MKRVSKRQVCLSVALVSIALLLVCEFFGFSSLLGLEDGSRLALSLDMSISRALGGVAFLAMLINLGYKVLDPKKSPFWRSILISLPAFVIAVNNFPFSTVISGEAKVTEGAPMLILLLFECLMVGLFEEMAFRGVIFLRILKKNPEDKLWQFTSIALSSVIFGLVHLVNLIESSPGAVFLQIGYSALIGAMCAVILLKTANIWLCVVIHGLYNFAGAVIPRMGEGRVWDTFTVVLTVIVSLAVVAYMIVLFLRGKTKTTKEIYKI